MRFVILFYTISMLFVAAIVVVAVLWCHLSHIRVDQGPMLFTLWGTHGVHIFDVAVLGLELILVTLFSITLIAGFSRGH